MILSRFVKNKIYPHEVSTESSIFELFITDKSSFCQQ